MLAQIFITTECQYHFGLKKTTVSYVDIKQIDWYWIEFGSNKNSTLKRMKNYRLKIKKGFGSLIIAASFIETNVTAENGGEVSLRAVYEKLCSHTRQYLT